MFQYAFFLLSSEGNCTWATGSWSVLKTKAGHYCGSKRDSQFVSHQTPVCSHTKSTCSVYPHTEADLLGDYTVQSKAKGLKLFQGINKQRNTNYIFNRKVSFQIRLMIPTHFYISKETVLLFISRFGAATVKQVELI